MKRIYNIQLLLLLLVTVASCSKSYLETEPSNGVTQEEVFSSTEIINTALSSAYKEMFAYGTGGSTGHDNFGQKAIDLASDLMGDDMVVHQQGYGWFNDDYQYSEWTQATNNSRSDIAWYYYYDIVRQMNFIISNVDLGTDSDAEKETLVGQAYGMRAYAYFFLVNLMQQTYVGSETKPGVPIYTEPALEGSARMPVSDVYDQIISDLGEAESLLTGKTVASKVNIDVHVVQGLRARVALIMEDWSTAATYANKARTGYSLMSETQYQNGFSLISNPEWMWGSQIPNDQATIYASFFSHMDVSTGGYAALGSQKKITKALYDEIPDGDVRKTVFIEPGTGGGSYPDYTQTKFHVQDPNSWAADYVYMRVAEMYLIEAEALARQSMDGNAITVLEELVQSRYPAYSASGLSGTDLIDEILLQRRIELWGEGFALMDIKRLKTGLNRPTGSGNHGNPNFNPIVYTLPAGDPSFLMRIPQREIDNNLNMTAADQNP